MASRKKLRETAVKPRRPLTRYRSMRDFNVTAEPRGETRKISLKRSGKNLPFVVQKHAASRLHYDFRLGWNGVLKSWAVAKGPSYDPGDKRLAVQVEDHPWEYRDFEGTIPKGQYGGGTVMLWDKGDWVPLGDVDQGLKDGHLKFDLHGKKLKGRWVLVRMRGRAGGPDKPNWLLIKEKDEFARESSDEPITEKAPDSAASGQSMDEIASGNGHVWQSNRTNGRGTKRPARAVNHRATSAPPSRRSQGSAASVNLKGASRERFPGFIAPQLAQQTTAVPAGGEWLHELKLDGYRIQIQIRTSKDGKAQRKSIRLLTRKGLDWTARMPDIVKAASNLNMNDAILDGEAVALDERGVSNFADLQAAFHEGRQRYITYFAFDLLHLDGHNLRALPLADRKRILEQILQTAGDTGPLRFSEGINGDGKTVFEKACHLGAEGIVSKLSSAKYTSGRNGAWLKLKCHLEQEFVIGGFTLPSKGSVGIGALLLGYYEGDKLRYAGRSGTGFTQATHKMLRARLDRLERKESPFADVPREMRRGAHWVKPEPVAQIAFSTWTRDNLVRQAAFKGLREDKPAREVIRETMIGHNEAGKHRAKRSSEKATRSQPETRSMKRTTQTLTHPDKVLDAESGMTKQQLADYYSAVAGHLLPHIADRPLSVVRCPDGTGKACFFQKHVGMGLPDGVKSIPIKNRKTGESEDYLTVDSVEGLVGLAQMGVLEIHPWGSRNKSLEKPDRIIFDLDPDPAIKWRALVETARELRSRLKGLRLESFVKTTGGKGLHVVVPVQREHDWPSIKAFAHDLVSDMETAKPDLYVTKMTKAARKNRIYLDYLRNDREATSVAPYSPRARTGAPVAMPLHWNELNAATAPAFHVADFAQWRRRLNHDPWEAMLRSKQRLSLAAGGASGTKRSGTRG
jgi:bifunctional non-homologous end joining protein LigD